MRTIDVLVYDRKDGAMDIRANGLLSSLKGRYKINFYYKDKKGWLANVAYFLKYVNRIMSDRPAIIYVVDIGPAAAFLFIILRTFRLKFKIIADTGDLAYELKKIMGRSYLEQQIARWAEWYLLNKAAAFIVRGRLHKDLFNKKGHNNVFFLPDGVDTSFFFPYPATDFRKEMGLENTFTLGTMSTLGHFPKLNYYQAWEIIELINILRNENITGIVIGDGPGLNHLKTKTREYNLDKNIIFLGRIPYLEIPKYLSLLDVFILTKVGDITHEVTTSGKLPLALACGCYIIANKVGEQRFVLPEEMLLPYQGAKDLDYPNLLAHKILNIYNHRSLLEIKRLSREIAKKKYDYQVLTEQFKAITESFN